MFKKENYEVRGRVLPIVYAVIRHYEVDRLYKDRGVAFFQIGETRDLAMYSPLETKMIQFDIKNCDTFGFRDIYLSAKQVKIVKDRKENGELVEVEQYPYFYDWEDAYEEII